MHKVKPFSKLLLYFLTGFSTCAQLTAFETKPWFYSLFDFQAYAEYELEYFPTVNKGINPTHYSSLNNFARAGVIVPFLPTWEAELALELNSTKKYSFSFESIGASVRKQFLSDIIGDPVSLAAGINLVLTSQQRLFDVVTPYHNLANFEAGVSVGKEFAPEDADSWHQRVYGYLALGQANKGVPWIKLLADAKFKFENCLILSIFSDGYFGLGNQNTVNIGLFNSYANISHQSIDLGAKLTYLFEIWGKLSAEYAYRVYASSYPAETSSFVLRYQLPWSL